MRWMHPLRIAHAGVVGLLLMLAGCSLPTGAPFPSASSAILAAGGYHSLFLDASGDVWGWGRNDFGQVGDGSSVVTRVAPSAVSMPANTVFVAISGGAQHSLAIDQNGNAWAWGRNDVGQLGDGTTTDRPEPVLVDMPPNTTFESVSTGAKHSLAIDQNGNVWAWGRNNFGQLGDGTTVSKSMPAIVSMPPNTTFDSIAGGSQHSIAIDQSGNAWAWGYNGYGQLGDGTTTDRTEPVPADMPPGTTFASIEAGLYSTMALDASGGAWAWGDNLFGQLGDGTTTSRDQPTAVDMPPTTDFVAAHIGYEHALAIDQDGNAWAWGYNGYGQLGDGTTSNRSQPHAVQMPTGTAFVSIGGGVDHSLAIDQEGDVWAWGGNSGGQLGDGTTTNRAVPTSVTLP